MKEVKKKEKWKRKRSKSSPYIIAPTPKTLDHPFLIHSIPTYYIIIFTTCFNDLVPPMGI